MRFVDTTARIVLIASIAAVLVSGPLWLSTPIFAVQMFVIGTCAWLVLMLSASRQRDDEHATSYRRMILVLGICAVLVAPLHDMFSDDVRRYLWDGIVVASGDNPYASAPLQQPLVAHRTTLPDGVMLPDDMPYASMRTIYPPGTQLVAGGIVAALGVPTPQSFELGWWFCIVLLLGAALCVAHQRDRLWIALAACSPVFLMHGLADVHSDALMSGFALLGIIMLSKDRIYLSAIFIALAVTMKYVPVLLVPALLIGRSRREQATILCLISGVVSALYLPFISASWDVLGSLPVFAEHWQANSLFYSMWRWVDPVWWTPERIRILSAVVAVSLAALIWIRYRVQPIIAAMMTYIAVLVCSPVTHAWYIILPLLLFPFAPLRSTITWTATMWVYGIFTATYKGDGVWFEHPIALACEFVPVVIALIRDIQRGPLLLGDQHRTCDRTLT